MSTPIPSTPFFFPEISTDIGTEPLQIQFRINITLFHSEPKLLPFNYGFVINIFTPRFSFLKGTSWNHSLGDGVEEERTPAQQQMIDFFG